MENLDRQLFQFSDKLRENIGVETKYLGSICTTIYDELRHLSIENLIEIEKASPVRLELRIEELTA